MHKKYINLGALQLKINVVHGGLELFNNLMSTQKKIHEPYILLFLTSLTDSVKMNSQSRFTLIVEQRRAFCKHLLKLSNNC